MDSLSADWVPVYAGGRLNGVADEGHTDFNYRNRLLSKVDRYPTIEVPGRRIVVIKTFSEKASSEEMESVSE